MNRMAGKRTLVTGVASPIGSAVVRALVEAGARVLATDATDESVEAAIAALDLDENDDVITRGLDESALGSWWDLANLIAAFYDELDVFVHIPQHDAGTSLPLAVDRLKQALWNAEDANPGGPCLVLVAPSGEGPAAAAEQALARDGSKFRVHVVEPETPVRVAARVVEWVGGLGR